MRSNPQGWRDRPGDPSDPAPVQGFGVPDVGAVVLLADASRGLAAARTAGAAAERYRLAHLAALRAGAAVVAVRVTERPRRAASRPSLWAVLAQVAPELGEWAAYFRVVAATSAALRVGAASRVSTREADDLVRDAEAFLTSARAAVAATCCPRRPVAGSAG